MKASIQDLEHDVACSHRHWDVIRGVCSVVHARKDENHAADDDDTDDDDDDDDDDGSVVADLDALADGAKDIYIERAAIRRTMSPKPYTPHLPDSYQVPLVAPALVHGQC